MINITVKPETFELTIEGHAGQDVKGKDIVCSAISALFYTLGQTLMISEDMLKEKPVIKNEDGNGYISCKPKDEYVGNISCTYRTVLVGLRLVADTFENFVTMHVVGWQE